MAATSPPERLAAMTAAELTQLLQQVNTLRDQANAKVIQAETQITTIEQQLTTLQTQIKEQFQVDTLEGLEASITTKAADLAKAFDALNKLLNPQAAEQEAAPAVDNPFAPQA